MFDSEKSSLEKLLSGRQQEVDSQRAELDSLRASSQELQRQRDLLRQQREDLEMQLTRQRTEAQRRYKRSTEKWTNTSSLLRLFSNSVCLQNRSVTHVLLWSATQVWIQMLMIYMALLQSCKRGLFLLWFHLQK